MFNILIADDDPMILEGLTHIVDWHALGLCIIGLAGNGKEALDILSSQRVDILLTDIRMPEMDGFEVIEWIRARNLPIRCVVLSGYDDYAYLQQAIKLGIDNYLIKSINEDELVDTLFTIVDQLEHEKHDPENPQDVLRDSILERWMLGRINETDLLERAQLIHLNITECYFQVHALRLIHSSSGAIEASLRRMEAFFATLRYPFVQSFLDMEGDVILITGDNQRDLSPSFAPLLRELSDKLGDDWFSACGEWQSGLSHVRYSYQKAKHLLLYAIIQPVQHSVSAEDYGTIPEMEIDITPFREAVVAQDRDTALAYVQRKLNQTYNIEMVPPDLLTSFVYGCTLAVRHLALDNGLHSVVLSRAKTILRDEIFALRTRQQLTEWLMAILDEYFASIDSPRLALSPLTQRVLQYVEEHYSEELSLKQLAVRFSCNSAYLGRLFKSEYGETFSTYLNSIRIRQACRLLDNTKYPTGKIAEMVGYSSMNYFISVFKRIMGCYPRRFRLLRNTGSSGSTE